MAALEKEQLQSHAVDDGDSPVIRATGDEQSTEHINPVTTHADIDVVETTTANPYTEVNFIGTYAAITLATCGAFVGYAMPVTTLTEINAAIGSSSSNYTWVPLAWTLASAVGFTLVGRLSDLFGRRWFFISCSTIAGIGAIVGATAQHINSLIGASVLLGWGAAGQISFNYVLGELVPVKHRYAANGLVFFFTLPFSGLGPYIARLFIAHTAEKWRASYWLALGLDAAATLCWFLFYHPPKFEKLHRNRTIFDELKDLDFGGIFLFVGGWLLFLLGLSWGGSIYPWKSAHVLGTLIPGFCILIIFVLYECFMPLRRPLIPMHLFRNYDYVVVTTLSCVGGMVYYSSLVLFPEMVAVLYTTSPTKGGILSSTIGLGVVAGQFTGSFLAVPGGHMRIKVILIASGLCAFVAGLAAATHSEAIGAGLSFCAGLMVGFLEVIVSTTVTIILDDPSEMGTGAGVFGSIRAAGGVLATAIYTTILKNEVTKNITKDVIPPVLKAGLSPKALPSFLSALSSGSTSALEKVPGITKQIIEVGAAGFREAYASAFKVVFLATIAFGGLAVIAACFHRDIDDSLTHVVIRRLAPSGKGDGVETREKGSSSE